MNQELPSLGFAPDALTPFLSAETFEYHHGKHHQAYVTNLNRLAEGTDLDGLSLADMVQKAEGAVFNNAAQHYNHSFYWKSITPGSGGPSGELLAAIERDFGSPDDLKGAFTAAAKGCFGSGWAWLVKDAEGKLHVKTTGNAGCPLTDDVTPLLTCDVWEHAYYVDYRNDRGSYVEAHWQGANWDFAGRCFTSPEGIEAEILGAAAAAS